MSYVERLAQAVYFGLWLVAAFMLFGGLYWAATGTLLLADSTDSASERSGLGLHVDYGTGCQYLTSHSGLTPRLRKDGTPMCETAQ